MADDVRIKIALICGAILLGICFDTFFLKGKQKKSLGSVLRRCRVMFFCEVKKHLLKKDSGSSIVAFPFIIILFMMLLYFVFNVMFISYNKHHAQLAMDSATRAAVLAVDEDKVTHVKNPDGSYHVYTPLDVAGAVKNYVTILDCYDDEIVCDINVTAVNPVYIPTSATSGEFWDTGTTGTVKVWNSAIGEYVNTTNTMLSKQQFEAGVFTIVADVKLDNLVGMDLLGLSDSVSIKAMKSQSSARGSIVTH